MCTCDLLERGSADVSKLVVVLARYVFDHARQYALRAAYGAEDAS